MPRNLSQHGFMKKHFLRPLAEDSRFAISTCLKKLRSDVDTRSPNEKPGLSKEAIEGAKRAFFDIGWILFNILLS